MQWLLGIHINANLVSFVSHQQRLWILQLLTQLKILDHVPKATIVLQELHNQQLVQKGNFYRTKVREWKLNVYLVTQECFVAEQGLQSHKDRADKEDTVRKEIQIQMVLNALKLITAQGVQELKLSAQMGHIQTLLELIIVNHVLVDFIA